jgi:hypothetical protein
MKAVYNYSILHHKKTDAETLLRMAGLSLQILGVLEEKGAKIRNVFVKCETANNPLINY